MTYQHNNATLNYLDIGSGTPLLCLSAYPYDSQMWREQHTLSDTARLIIPDYRGIGGSSLTDGPYTMEMLADDQFALLDHLGIKQAVVMGVSMGCYIAFAMYARRPERFKGLILADTRPEADSPEAAERRKKTVEGLRAEGTAALRSRVSDLMATYTRQHRPDLVADLQGMIAGLHPEGLAWLMLGMSLRPDRTALLPKINVPTMILCGDEDTVSPPEGMRKMAEQIPNAQFHLIPRAGHLTPIEQPAIVNGYVREFLQKLK